MSISFRRSKPIRSIFRDVPSLFCSLRRSDPCNKRRKWCDEFTAYLMLPELRRTSFKLSTGKLMFGFGRVTLGLPKYMQEKHYNHEEKYPRGHRVYR